MGEFDLIAKIRDRIGAPSGRVLVGPGDDAAVARAGGVTATTVDAVVEGVHFLLEQVGPREVGYKALAAAASDLAAMGAEPGEGYAVLGMGPSLGEEGALEAIDGMLEAAEDFGLALAGGDIVAAGELFIAVTAVGHAANATELVTRGGSRPGDVVVLTGEIGGSAAGAELMRMPDPAAVPALDRSVAEALRRRQMRPPARIATGRALASCGATAMIDLSDGLGADAGHVAAAGGVAIAIELDRVPIAEGVAAVAAAAGLDPEELAASGGEDYELLATIPSGSLESAMAAAQQSGVTLSAIGEVREGAGVELRSASGRSIKPRGFDQLAPERR